MWEIHAASVGGKMWAWPNEMPSCSTIQYVKPMNTLMPTPIAAPLRGDFRANGKPIITMTKLTNGYENLARISTMYSETS